MNERLTDLCQSMPLSLVSIVIVFWLSIQKTFEPVLLCSCSSFLQDFIIAEKKKKNNSTTVNCCFDIQFYWEVKLYCASDIVLLKYHYFFLIKLLLLKGVYKLKHYTKNDTLCEMTMYSFCGLANTECNKLCLKGTKHNILLRFFSASLEVERPEKVCIFSNVLFE